jgi:hypothetical protein
VVWLPGPPVKLRVEPAQIALLLVAVVAGVAFTVAGVVVLAVQPLAMLVTVSV